MAVDLQKRSGLPILFNEKKLALEFRGDFPEIEKSERSLDELKPYLKNSETKQKRTDPVYYVWRFVHLKNDNQKIKSANLRYDLTLIPPGTIDGEFIKTAGHCHLFYPEIYEVFYGRAYFLIQSFVNYKDFKNIKSVYLIEAEPGEKIIIPPGFGHNIINVFKEPLLTANLVSEKSGHDYTLYKNNHGACYYFLDNGNLIDIVKNPNYDSVPEIKKFNVKFGGWQKKFDLENKPLYSLLNDVEKLKFLNHPVDNFIGFGNL